MFIVNLQVNTVKCLAGKKVEAIIVDGVTYRYSGFFNAYVSKEDHIDAAKIFNKAFETKTNDQ